LGLTQGQPPSNTPGTANKAVELFYINSRIKANKEERTMNKELATFNSGIATIGTVVTAALGGWDIALQVLVTFVVLDYVTGLTVAIMEQNVSSAVGFKGIVKKVMIFALLYVAVQADKATGSDIIRSFTIMFYIANEGISILENAGKMGVPYPGPLKNILVALKQKSNGETKEGE
jgi:toxin secretion/phage lysis holin